MFGAYGVRFSVSGLGVEWLGVEGAGFQIPAPTLGAVLLLNLGQPCYRGTSLIRNTAP